MIDVTEGGRATVNGELVEYQQTLEQPCEIVSVGEGVRVKGGLVEAYDTRVLCISGVVQAYRDSRVAMLGGRVEATDSEVRLLTGAENCQITAHGSSKVYLSLGIRMCTISAYGDTVIYVPGDAQTQGPGEDLVVVTRGLYSCEVYTRENAHIEYLS